MIIVAPPRNAREILRYWWRASQRSVSLAIVYVCTAVFLIMAVAQVLRLADWRSVASVLGLSYAGAVQRFLVYQFFTAPFIHVNVVHLLFNMLTLWMLGPSIERVLGKRDYVILSVVSGLAAGVAFVAANVHTTNVIFGYSGIIFGILVAQAKYFPEQRIAFFAIFPIKMKYAVLILGALELYLTIVPGQSAASHLSQLFGAVGAWVYLMLRQRRRGLGIPKARLHLPPALTAKIDRFQARRRIPKKL